MRRFFNNCRGRPHASLFGSGAFYDFDLTGAQANMARDISKGDECIVATPNQNGDIMFDWFTFSHERLMSNPTANGTQVRVLFGKRLRSASLPKPTAARTEPYAIFFNVLGHFKRPSVIVPRHR